MANGGDVRALTAIAGIEQVAVFSYTAASENGALPEAERTELGRLAGFSGEHVAAVATSLEALGAVKPAPIETAADADKVVPGIAAATRREDVLQHLHDVEIAALGACHDAFAGLLDAKLVQTVAAIMAAHGQRLVVLRRWLERDPLPEAFETGRG